MRIDRMTITGWVVAFAVLAVLLSRPTRPAARLAPETTPIGESSSNTARTETATVESPKLFRIDGPLRDVAGVEAPVSERYARPAEISEVQPAADFYQPPVAAYGAAEGMKTQAVAPSTEPLSLTPSSGNAIPPAAFAPQSRTNQTTPLAANQTPGGEAITNQHVAQPAPSAANNVGLTAVGPVREGDTETTIVSRPKIELRGDGPGMHAVDAQAMKHVVRGFALGDRAALYSARTEFLRALRMITQAIDAQVGLPPEKYATAASALSTGLQALREAEDFNPAGGDLEGDLDLRAIIEGHRTSICKTTTPATALEATQRYFDFAREELARSVGRNRTASQALTGLGKSYSILLDDESNPDRTAGPKAMVYHLAALQCDPRNHLASNELGVLYGRYGQWKQAKQSFLQSLAVRNDHATWANLAQTHMAAGERDLAQLAMQERNMIAPRELPNRYSAIDGSPSVRWVDPRAFGGPPVEGIVAQRGQQPAPSGANRPATR